MKIIPANIEDLRELYVASLEKALDMEQHITKALPKMIEKSSSAALQRAFETHLRETEGHVSIVENILKEATGDADTQKCKVVAALISEAEDSIKDAGDPTICDVSMIGAAQQVEHHEMAVYGTLRAWAELLGESAQAQQLETILEQEKNADAVLTEISGEVNSEAPTVRAA